MKLLTLLCLLAGCLLATTGVSQEAKKDEIKFDMVHLEKAFGIKLKGAKFQPGKRTDDRDTLITMTLEFTKDVQEIGESPNGLPSLRKLFTGKPTMSGMQLRCYLFDEDGVAFTKLPPGKIEGELTGKKGDAFRITQSVPGDVMAKTKRISFREEAAKK